MKPTEGQYAQEPQLANFRVRLRARMNELAITPQELADEVGVTKQVVWLWLGGLRIPSSASLIRLCRALDTPADVLLGFDYNDFLRRVRAFAGARAERPAGAHFTAEDESTRKGEERP
ncbi:MAG: helix-turn-helix transcriptional regulator [Collinsella sp.]|nr:helix-turn-helix transcriptional regulator [Collinsella sp.]